jgi:hypothetical protein
VASAVGVVGIVVGSEDKLDANSVDVGTIVVVPVVPVGIGEVALETISVVEILKRVTVVKGDVLVLIGLLIIVVLNAELVSVVVRGTIVVSSVVVVVVRIGVVAKETGKVDKI